MSDDLGIPGVRRLAAKHDRGEARTAEDFIHQPELDLPEALPAEFWAEVTGPQALVLDLLLERADQRVAARVLDVIGMDVEEREGLNLGGDKPVHPVELVLEIGVGLEIPGHKRTLSRVLLQGLATGVTSNVEDLAIFITAEFRRGPAGGDNILSAASWREMLRVRSVDETWESGSGLGFDVSRFKDRTYVGHGGGYPGNTTMTLALIDDKVGLIVLTNTHGSIPRDIARHGAPPGLKSDPGNEHIVPRASQAVAVLRAAMAADRQGSAGVSELPQCARS